MIKVGYISDLHGDMKSLAPCMEELDVLALAGDISAEPKSACNLIRNLQEQILISSKTIILYVLGNHEYYKRLIQKTVEEYRAALESLKNVYVLEKNFAVVRGVKFLGATLWSDLSDPTAAMNVSKRLNDFYYIQQSKRVLLQSESYHKMWEESASWINDQLEFGYNGPIVIVTHHSPSSITTPQQFKYSLIRKGFHSNMEEMILKHRPNLWIYGHDHVSGEHRIGKTEIVSNQVGYLHERKTRSEIKVKRI